MKKTLFLTFFAALMCLNCRSQDVTVKDLPSLLQNHGPGVLDITVTDAVDSNLMQISDAIYYSTKQVKLTLLKNKALTAIPENWFNFPSDDESVAYCDNILSVTIPEGVKSIGLGAFAFCTALKTVKMPKSLEYIADYSFVFNLNLRDVFLQNPDVEISDSASFCSFFNYNVPEKYFNRFVDKYPALDFKVIDGPESVSKMLSVAELDKFIKNSKCQNLEITITDPSDENIDYIGDVIKKCKRNIYLKLQNNSRFHLLTENLFSRGYDDNNDIIPVNSLRSIEIPDCVHTIAENAFLGCMKLDTIVMSKNVETYGRGAFGYCYSLDYVPIPNGITEIEPTAFMFCSRVSNFELPQNITNIRSFAFLGCNNVKEITIPKSVRKIESGAFFRCSELSTVTLEGNTEICDDVFASCSDSISFYVPQEYYSDYEVTYPDYKFKVITK